MIKATILKISIRLCLAVSSFIFFEVTRAKVINTMAVNIMTLCSEVQ